MIDISQYKSFIGNCTSNGKSVRNYSDFNRINKCINELGYNKTILEFDNSDDLVNLINQLNSLTAFQQINQKGNNQYSNALKMYLHFLNAKELFSKNITVKRYIDYSAFLPLQQIFYGAPGTGKSHKVKEVTETLPKSDVFRTTFHPDSDYSTFVGCYKPKMVKAPIRDGSGHEITSACEDEKKRIAYEYEPQAFLKAYVRAYETNEPVFLVIEEINRGNCAQIFGDMFQLLDRNEDGESDYAIKPETAIQEFLNEKLEDCDIADEAIKSGEEMRLPANLHIWATMNTSDQSLFPIDSAFKRRWDWEYVSIRYEKTKKEKEKNDPKDNFDTFTITIDDKHHYLWTDFLKNVNEKILSVTDSEDKQMGEYFIKKSIEEKDFINKVMFYLWSEVGKDFYNTTNAFFKLPKDFKDKDGNDKKEFSFNELFKGNAIALLEGFMAMLEVKSEEEKVAKEKTEGTEE